MVPPTFPGAGGRSACAAGLFFYQVVFPFLCLGVLLECDYPGAQTLRHCSWGRRVAEVLCGTGRASGLDSNIGACQSLDLAPIYTGQPDSPRSSIQATGIRSMEGFSERYLSISVGRVMLIKVVCAAVFLLHPANRTGLRPRLDGPTPWKAPSGIH
jgi:hypothetical protein